MKKKRQAYLGKGLLIEESNNPNNLQKKPKQTQNNKLSNLN
jgi:hypothetical protein